MSALLRSPAGWTLVCLAALVVAGCSGAEARKNRHMEKGEAFLAAGDVEKARVEFSNALQIVPTDAEARYENGVVNERLGKIRQAAQFYLGAIDANADHVKARTALGRLYVYGGAPQKALEAVKPGLEKHPDDAGLLTVRAAARAELKDASGAMEDAQRAVKLAPGSEDAVAVLAGLYKSQGQEPQGQALLTEAIKRIPATVDLRLALAQLDASLGQQAEVEALLVDLVRLQPKDRAHRIRLAQFYARGDRLDDAERVLRDGIKTLPEDRDLKAALVDFLATRRGRDLADKELSAFIAARPQDDQLRFLQAQFYEQGKDYQKAESVYRQIITAQGLDDAGLTARNRLAAMLVLENKPDDAKRLIAEVLAKSPRDDDALILRGNLALAGNDPRTAIADLRAVLRDQPNAAGVMRVLARAHVANGELALAEETMRQAVEANPADTGARLDLAELLARLGKADQAKPVIDDLVKQQPNNARALELQFRIDMTTKDLVSAQAAANAMVATRPKAAEGYYFQGQVAENDKRPEDALRLYSAALEAEPNTVEPLAGIVRILVAQKRLPEALKKLDEVSARNPQSPYAANIKGEVLLNSQRGADAESAFNSAIERAPQWWVPYHNLALAHLLRHDESAARTTLQAGIAKASLPDELETQLASLDEHAGKVDDAIDVYERALKRNPKSDVASNNLAMLLVTYKTDATSLERAKELSARFATSVNPDFLDTYGWVLYKRGDARGAVTALQAALAKLNNSPVALYHLGMAQVSAGEADAARANLERSLQSGKPFQGSEEAKATLERLAKSSASGGVPAKT